MAKVATLTPPNHCKRDLQNRITTGKSSGSRRVAPVVVIAETLSKYASRKPKSGTKNLNGRAKNTGTKTQNNITKTIASAFFSGAFVPEDNITNKSPKTPIATPNDAITIALETSWLIRAVKAADK